MTSAFFTGALATDFVAMGFFATDFLATTLLMAGLTGFLTALMAFFTGFFAATGDLSFYSLVTGKRAVIPCPDDCSNRITRNFMILAGRIAGLRSSRFRINHLDADSLTPMMVGNRIKEL